MVTIKIILLVYESSVHEKIQPLHGPIRKDVGHWF